MNDIVVLSLTAARGMPGQPLPLDTALSTAWPFDACLVAYSNPCRQSKKWGDRSLSRWVILDFDYEDKSAKADGYTIWEARPTIEQLPHFPGWRAWYPTPGGYRLIYELTREVEPEELEGLGRWFSEQIKTEGTGFMCDIDGCSDWTHLYRAPFVVRNDWSVNTNTGECLEGGAEFSEHFIDPDQIPFIPSESVNVLAQVKIDQVLPQIPSPSPQNRRSLVKVAREFKSASTHSELIQAVEDQMAIPHGCRDTSAAKGTGVFSRAGRKLDLTVQEVFAELVEPFRDAENSLPAEPGLTLKAWNNLQRYWETDEATMERNKVNLDIQIQQAEATVVEKGLIELWKENNDNVPAAWGQKEMIEYSVLFLPGAKGRLVLGVDGCYRPTGEFRGQVMTGVIRKLGHEAIITRTTDDQTGQILDIPGHKIHEAFAHAVCDKPSGYLWDGLSGLRVDFSGMGVTNYRERLAPADGTLRPERNLWVEEWLTAALGEEGRRALEHWFSLLLEMQTCSVPCLILAGRRLSGKSKIAQAVAGVLRPTGNGQSGALLPFAEVSQDGRTVKTWGDASIISPIQCCDDLGELKGAARTTFLETLRQTTTSKVRLLNPKGKGQVLCDYYPRLMVTTNHMDLAADMIRSIDEASHEAVQASKSRLLPLEFKPEASLWLSPESLGEAGIEGAMWALRCHILWLTENKAYAAKQNGSTYVPGTDRALIPAPWEKIEEQAEEQNVEALGPLRDGLIEAVRRCSQDFLTANESWHEPLTGDSGLFGEKAKCFLIQRPSGETYIAMRGADLESLCKGRYHTQYLFHRKVAKATILKYWRKSPFRVLNGLGETVQDPTEFIDGATTLVVQVNKIRRLFGEYPADVDAFLKNNRVVDYEKPL